MAPIQYTPTLKDYLLLNLCVVASRRFIVKTLFVEAVLLIALLVQYQASGNLDKVKTTLCFVIGFPVFVALMLVFVYLNVRKLWKNAPELQATKEYLFDEKGLHVTSPSFQGSVEWNIFTEADVRFGLFLLKMGQPQYYYFPTANITDKAAFTELVSQKVKATARFQKYALEGS